MSKQKIYLEVVYMQREKVKALGARWDASKKAWYIYDDMDQAPFKEWIPEPIIPNIRSNFYYIGRALHPCWRCQKQTYSFCIAVPKDAEFYSLDEDYDYQDENEPDRYNWTKMTHGFHTCIPYLNHPTEDMVQHLKRLAPNYRPDYSKTIESMYWMNHCDHCGIKQGDNSLHQESDAPFFPDHIETAKLFQLLEIKTPVEFNGCSSEVWSSEMEDVFPHIEIISSN